MKYIFCVFLFSILFFCPNQGCAETLLRQHMIQGSGVKIQKKIFRLTDKVKGAADLLKHSKFSFSLNKKQSPYNEPIACIGNSEYKFRDIRLLVEVESDFLLARERLKKMFYIYFYHVFW